MSLQISDPLALLPYQSGLLAPPLEEGAAQGQSALDSQQLAVVLGEPVPIVFCRRVSNIGGAFVSPRATEGRYENNGTTNELTVRLQLVLSEGELPALQIRDVFQRACRVGTWKQSYDARTENWTPGNFITEVAGTEFWNCPYYCGTGGTYENMTTLSYLNTHADGDDTWNKQVHCFVREGMQVTRILDDTYGPSNNLIDLSLYLIRESSRFPEAMLDLVAMEDAATFTNVNGLFYNGIFEQSTNLEDWLQQISRNFLLRVSDKAGKKAFKPRLPVNGDGTIDTSAVTWVYTFTEEHILPDGFDIDYIPLSERKSICAQMLWRQQPDNDIGIIRSTEVRFQGEAPDGPFQQYDLSQFCTSENHAVKVGVYEVARRKYVTHTLRLRVRPDGFNSILALGDIVRVQLKRETDESAATLHDYLYEVERINRDISGRVELDLIHFPVNTSGQSILAVLVNNATGPGLVVPTGRNDFTCDIDGRRDDTTELTSDPYTPPVPPDPADYEYSIPTGQTSGSPGGGTTNPSDPIATTPSPTISGASGPNGAPIPGDVLTLSEVCPGMRTEWFLVPADGGDPIQVAAGVAETYLVGPDATGFSVFGRGCCPDPAAPGGFGQCNESEITEAVGGELGSFGGPFVGGGLRVRFKAPSGVYYEGNWLVPQLAGGWVGYAVTNTPSTQNWFFYPIRADGSRGDLTVLPKEVVSGNDLPVANGTTLEFTLAGQPYTPPYGGQ